MPTLNWIGKDKVINHHQDVPFRVLERCYSYGAPDSGNMIIHGDNLDALKALLPKYEGRVKCIYIDPPYNTGNEGWVYNDNVNDPKIRKWLGDVVGREGEDLSRHDKWLCMIYPRLKLLQRLLANDGAIFISIDDNEQANLKLICDEIFGASNFICTFIWQKRYSAPPDTKDVGYVHETLLMYKKTASFFMGLLPFSSEQIARYQNPDNDIRGIWKSMDYTCRYTKDERPNLYYSITNPNTGEEIWPKETRVWAMSKEVHEINVRENRIWWGAKGRNSVPALKNFASEIKQGRMPWSLLLHAEVGHTDEATKELRAIIPDFKFTPKPTRLIMHLFKIANVGLDDIILDSFAGSGTTAHAVLNMNKADGGNRKFILVEMMDYAETITAERIRRVIDGYSNIPGTGGGFAFCELGEPLMFANGNLNEAVDTQKIREYVWYMETKQPAQNIDLTENPYMLGVTGGTAYYFHYEKDAVTTLDTTFLITVKSKAERFVIYADQCALPGETLSQYNITFKKIPRDIVKL